MPIPFAWGGLILDVPDTYRPMKIDGTSYHGRFILGDQDRARLEVQWATNTSRRFKPDKFVRNRALSALARVDRKRSADQLHDVTHAHFSPMVRYDDKPRNVTRWVGYCPATKRAVDIIHYNGSPTEDATFANDLLPTLRDQPMDQPQRWAVFDFQFTVLPNFRYAESKLNLGDMTVTFEDAKRNRIWYRQIHPAKLALVRQPLDKWLLDVAKSQDKRYLAPKPVKHHDVVCSIGEARGCDAQLRHGLKATLWRTPWILRWQVIHDAQQNRLLAIGVAARKGTHDDLAAAMLEGLHWS